MTKRDELMGSEPHPAAELALKWLQDELFNNYEEVLKELNAFSSCAIEDNKLAQVCAGTLERLMDGRPVGDRYLLGLAWVIRSSKEKP